MAMTARNMRCVAVVGAGASFPYLARGKQLAAELREVCGVPGRDIDAELARQQRVFGQDPTQFETELVALSQTAYAASLVRKEISRRYRARHPTLLGYELLAHLLKHRFIDAIISFNFDELLDQSLADELGASEYETIVSERDCVDVVSDPDAPSYVPMYIKMHGTASEQDSLRFTRESYYTIPNRIIEIIAGLLHADECFVANVGSSMTGFDFQYLLREPERLTICDLSYTSLSSEVRRQIQGERKEADVTEARILPAAGQGPKRWSCDEWMGRLIDRVRARARLIASGLVKTRSVSRHLAVAHLLGPESRTGKDLLNQLHAADGQLGEETVKEYHKKRTVLELAFALVKARGLLAVGPLAIDRAGQYYDRYSLLAGGTDRARWADLCAETGLVETEDFSDFLIPASELSPEDPSDPAAVGAERKLTAVNVKLLAERILHQVRNPWEPGDRKVLMAALEALQTGTEIELHSRDDRVCAKTFVAPVTLKTRTALEGYTRQLLEAHEAGRPAFFVSETGEWLLDDWVTERLRDSPIRAIIAFDSKIDELDEAYKDFKYKLKNPWWHNRHMTIAHDGKSQRGIYFARRQRSPYVTPVYLGDAQDLQRLMRGFEVMWEEGDHKRPARAPRHKMWR